MTTLPRLNSCSADYNRMAKYLRTLLDEHSSRTRFGRILRSTGKPIHRNTRNNPLPVYANRARRPDNNGPKRTLEHLNATKENGWAIFHVNRPDASVMLLAADWDCSAVVLDGPARADALSQRFDDSLGGRTYIEPSRNRRGRYNWLLVQLDEPVDVFVERLNRTNRVLSSVYGRAKDNDGVGFDAIKGVPWRASPNPRFNPTNKYVWHQVSGLSERNVHPCPDFITDPLEIYRWHRSHYMSGRFDRVEALEEQMLNFGILVTQPLCGLCHDGDGGTDRWERFMTWYRNPFNVIASSDLWSTLSVDVDAPSPATPAADPVSDLRPQSRDRPHVDGNRPGLQRAWEMLRNHEDVLESMNGAALLTIDQLGIASVFERSEEAVQHCLAVYATDGAGTDGSSPERVARASESLRRFAETYDPRLRAKPRFRDPEDVQDAGAIIDRLLSDDALRDVNAAGWSVDEIGRRYKKARTYVGRPLLHRAYCCVLKMIVTQDGALSIAGLRGLLRELGTGCNGSTLKVTLCTLVRLGLIRCVNPKYRFFAPKQNGGERIGGTCRQWSIADRAPLPMFIVPFVPHVVVATGEATFSDALATDLVASAPCGRHRGAEQPRLVA